MASTFSRMRALTSVVLAPSALMMSTPTASRPLYSADVRGSSAASLATAMSPRRIRRPPRWATTSRAKSAGLSRRPRRRMVRSVSGSLMRPTGAARFCVCSAATTSLMPTPVACSACGSSSTVSSRSMPPTTRTSATPLTPRSWLVTPGSTIRVSSGPVSVGDVSASCTIGKSFGSNRVRIGSSISVGRSFRICEMPSRMSCVASCRFFEK